MNMFDPRSSLTDIVIPKNGYYSVSATVYWDPECHADDATLFLNLNGVGVQRAGPVVIPANSPQSIGIGATIPCGVGDHLNVMAQFTPSTGIGALLTVFDPTSAVVGSFTVQYIGGF